MLASRLQARPLGQPQAQARQTAEQSSCWAVESHSLPPGLQSSLTEPHSHITHLKDGETEGLSDLLMAIQHRVGCGTAGWAPVAGQGWVPMCVPGLPASLGWRLPAHVPQELAQHGPAPCFPWAEPCLLSACHPPPGNCPIPTPSQAAYPQPGCGVGGLRALCLSPRATAQADAARCREWAWL